MAPANTEMDAGLRLRRVRTARGVRDLDRDALQRGQAQDALGPRSDADGEDGPESPDSPASPASPSSSSAAPPQATAPPAAPPPPPLQPPPGRPGNLAPPPPPPPPPAQPVQTTSTSSTTSRHTDPPVSTVPLPTLPSRVPPALTISTQPGQTTSPPPPPPPVANPADPSTSLPSASPVPTAPIPGSSSSSSTSVVVSVVPTPSSAGGSTTSLPFRETSIAVPTSIPSSAPVPVSTAGPQYQVEPTPVVPGQPLTSAVGSGVSDPQSTDNALSPVAAPGDGGARLHAGIAAGSIAGTALVSALIFYGYKVYKRRQDSNYLSKPYTSGPSGSRDAPTGGSVAVVTGVPVGAGATMGPQPGRTFATFDPKTNSQIMNDMFAAVYAAENGQAGMYSSDYNSMAAAGYPVEKKMEVQQVQYEVQEQYQTQEQGGRGTIASWLRGTKTPTFPRASWSSRYTAPSWARSSTASTMRASAAFPEGFRPASPLPPVPALPGTGTSNVGNSGAAGTAPAPAPVNNPNPNAGMVSRWSDSTRQTPPSPSTVRQSESISFRSVDYSADKQQPSAPPNPPIPLTSGLYQPFGPGLRRPSASLQKLRTSGDSLAPTSAAKEELAFEVSPLSPESEAITEKPTLTSPASPKTRRASGLGL